jgi:shikimate dehydrogenase
VDRLLIDLPETIATLREADTLGANITVPFKERAVPMMDRLSEDAHATGAVDTVTREGSKLIGHNTDVPGFRMAIDSLVGKQKLPKAAVVLGAGGAARAVVHALITSGFQHVIVFNRHLHRAEGLVRHFGKSAAHMELRAKPWHESVLEAELARTKLLVNASSVGRNPDETPIPSELLPPDLLVLDLLYTPRESRLLREAAAAGAAAVQNGDVMLINQSAAAFELWTGQPAPIDVLTQTLEAARDANAVADAADAAALEPGAETPDA